MGKKARRSELDAAAVYGLPLLLLYCQTLCWSAKLSVHFTLPATSMTGQAAQERIAERDTRLHVWQRRRTSCRSAPSIIRPSPPQQPCSLKQHPPIIRLILQALGRPSLLERPLRSRSPASAPPSRVCDTLDHQRVIRGSLSGYRSAAGGSSGSGGGAHRRCRRLPVPSLHAGSSLAPERQPSRGSQHIQASGAAGTAAAARHGEAGGERGGAAGAQRSSQGVPSPADIGCVAAQNAAGQLRC